jgi:hypothetical protein
MKLCNRALKPKSIYFKYKFSQIYKNKLNLNSKRLIENQ